jgi:DNA polymerase-3 subunit gamma/tau
LPEAPRATPTPGRIDTDAIRRSWPDVLTKVATISRATWTFVSQNTRVLDYNGDRLLLGLTTDGLLSALRGRNHAEVVRQALIEVIGVDTRVEGVISADAVSPDAVSPDAVSPDSGVIDTAVIDTAVIDSPTLAATAPLSAVSKDAEPDLSTPMQRARAAVAQEASIRQARSSTIADDSVVSPDDEDIEEAGVVGQPVIARVLGGTVIGELDQ